MLMDSRAIMRKMEEELRCEYQIELPEASAAQLHKSLSNAVMYAINEDWRQSRRQHESVRRAYYFSAEYLVGRMIYNNLFSLGILEDITRFLHVRGADIKELESIEDMALGNGGLGRLAACFLDSAATHDLPLDGYGLRYKFGLFRQTFKGGFQCEKADNWTRLGDPWSRRRDDKAVRVHFLDQDVIAVPYDMPIIGYKTSNIGTLRLWQAEPFEEFDFDLFNSQDYAASVREKNSVEDITRVLYPNDSTEAGKRLRVKQQYFLSSASLQDIVRRYKRVRGNDFSGFAAHCAIQLNDTHPALSIPELIRLLMEEGVSFNAALATAKQVFSYTNHTIMSEALEKWDIGLLRSVIPGVVDIIERINAMLIAELIQLGADSSRIDRMRIIDDGIVHMARLSTYVSSYVNGVAKIHSKLLADSVLSDWHDIWPERFTNKTNGITQRRWLGLCNPELTLLIGKRLGSYDFLTDLSKLSQLKAKIDDTMTADFERIKLQKKRQLCRVIAAKEGTVLNPGFIFDVQVKRMHEYKRQLMNAFSIYYIYRKLKSGELTDFYPTAFIFGAKAAPGYYRAKGVIKYINALSELINHDPDVNSRMQVVFVSNYNCSYAEHIIPAADISEQISPAGTEASGTGNMKLMLNGAVTLGTYDGANIEIAQAAGLENNYIFGAKVEELLGMRYEAKRIYDSDPDIRMVVDSLIDGTFSDGGTGMFRELYDSLIYGASWHMPDHYYILLDFRSYLEAKLRANKDYANRPEFLRKCLINVASAGHFSSDRTVAEYASEIWRIGKLSFD